MGLYEFEFEFISPYATPPRIFFSPLHSNGHVRCPLRCAVARYRAPCSARGSDHISQQNRSGYRGAAIKSKNAADRALFLRVMYNDNVLGAWQKVVEKIPNVAVDGNGVTGDLAGHVAQPKSLGTHYQGLVHGGARAREGIRTKTRCE